MKTDSISTSSKLSEFGDALEGYHVEGKDGTIGRVTHVTYDNTCLVVHTGRLFGKNHVVPARAVQSINPGRKQVLLDLAEDEVKGAPEYDSHRGLDEDCETRIEAYYGPLLEDRPPAGVRAL
jgi:hypothetical protein